MGSWTEAGRGVCVSLCPDCSRVCPIRTAEETGGPAPGPWHPVGPWTTASPRSRACHRSWGKASSCCPLQPAPTLLGPKSGLETWGEREERQVLRQLKRLRYTDRKVKRDSSKNSKRIQNKQNIGALPSSPLSPPTLTDKRANLLPLCSVKLPCISVCITDPPSSMWHGCWCTRTPLLMTSAPPLHHHQHHHLLPAPLPNNRNEKIPFRDIFFPGLLIEALLSGRHSTSPSRCNTAGCYCCRRYCYCRRCCCCLHCVSCLSWQRGEGGRQAGGRASAAGWEVVWETGAMTQPFNFLKSSLNFECLKTWKKDSTVFCFVSAHTNWATTLSASCCSWSSWLIRCCTSSSSLPSLRPGKHPAACYSPDSATPS